MPTARYLGPFGSSAQAELVKAAIEDALPLRRCTMKLGARGGGSACALLELGRCLGPCVGAVAEERYAALVATLEAALDGDPEPVLGPLRRRMAGYSAEQRYEQAAGARDRLEALTRALAEARRAAALASADEIILARSHPHGREVTVVRRGQLAAVGLVAADDQPGVERLLETASPPEPFEGPPPRHLADEVNLVTRWLEGAAGKAELLGVRGPARPLGNPVTAPPALGRPPGRAPPILSYSARPERLRGCCRIRLSVAGAVGYRASGRVVRRDRISPPVPHPQRGRFTP